MNRFQRWRFSCPPSWGRRPRFATANPSSGGLTVNVAPSVLNTYPAWGGCAPSSHRVPQMNQTLPSAFAQLRRGRQGVATTTAFARTLGGQARSLLLNVRKGSFRFGGERFLKAAGQSPIKGSTRFTRLLGLELRHSQVEKRIGVERPLPGAIL